jgi:hypothetical protein
VHSRWSGINVLDDNPDFLDEDRPGWGICAEHLSPEVILWERIPLL